MDRKSYKNKPQHLVTNTKTGGRLRIIHPADTHIGMEGRPQDLYVWGRLFVGGSQLTGSNTVVTGSSGLGVSGSLQLLTNGQSYLVASGGIVITSQSNGQVFIDGGYRWRTALDLDMTDLALITAAGNGNLVVNGVAWIVQNFANANTVTIGGGNGLRIKATTSTSTLTQPARTAPCVSIPLMSYLTGSIPDNGLLGLRVSWSILTSSLRSTNDSCFGLIDTLSNQQRHEFMFYRKSGTAVATEWSRLLLNNTLKTGFDVAAQTFQHNAYQMELPCFGADTTHLRTGVTGSDGWPTKWFPRATNASAAGTWAPIFMNQLSGSFLTLGLEAGTTAGTCEVKFARVKVEYFVTA